MDGVERTATMSPDERRLMDAHRGFSQRERTVRLLALGGWFSITEIHRVVGFCRLNSRVAEARKVFRRDGHPFDIVHSIRDGEHGYELVPLGAGEEIATASGPSVRGAGYPAAPAPSGSNLSSQADPDSQGEDGPLGLSPDEIYWNVMEAWGVREGQGQLL